MGLHDRLSKQNGNGAAGATAERPAAPAGPVTTHTASHTTGPATSDPYAELKSGVHHAVIAKLGPELFKRETAEDLSERVLHAVTEQLALDRTPLTRAELDRVAPDNPVFLTHASGHASFANAKAMQLSDVDGATRFATQLFLGGLGWPSA